MLSMPIEPMLAATTKALPTGLALPGGCWYEPKFDGYRALVFIGSDGARVQSRRGHDITDAFPDIAEAATTQLPTGTVVDGELLVWDGGRPNFSALQRRLARRCGTGVASVTPANMIVFDVLADGAEDTVTLPFRERRGRLEELGGTMAPPLQVVPGTDDLNLARQWLEDYRQADVGIEGLVVKGLSTPYQPAARGWAKLKIRDTAEAVVGAVIGTCENAERLVLGMYDPGGVLRIVGSTGVLRPAQRRDLREHLFSATAHPWPREISGGAMGQWGGAIQVVHLVEPTLVVEVSADRAFDHGRWRHVTRYLRPRPDLEAQSITKAEP